MMRYDNHFCANVLFAFFLLTCTSIRAQDTSVSYSQKIDIKNHEEQRFRLQVLVRTEVADDSAAARLWARVDKADGIGFFENMENRPIRSREWKQYSIEGAIDSGSIQIAFGGFCQYNGKFFFDDLKLDVESKQGKWTNLFTANFEMGKNPLKQSRVNANFKASVVKGQKGQGTHCLLIHGVKVPNYGVNQAVGKFAAVNGIKLYYEVYGKGTPLVVLHGNGGSIENASPFYPELIKKYKVIAVDSRAQGKSGDTEAPLTYDQMAADVNALLEELKVDSVLIWGQSDGAILGLILAMDYPKKVAKVLAFGSNIQPDTSAVYPWAFASMQKILKESTNPREKKLNQLMADYPRISMSKLSSIKAPVLVVAGDRDVIRPEHSLKIFQHIPNSQLCIIPGATHGAAWEKREMFLLIMGDFFDKPFRMPDTKNLY